MCILQKKERKIITQIGQYRPKFRALYSEKSTNVGMVVVTNISFAHESFKDFIIWWKYFAELGILVDMSDLWQLDFVKYQILCWKRSNWSQTNNSRFMNFWCRKSSKANKCIWEMFQQFNFQIVQIWYRPFSSFYFLFFWMKKMTSSIIPILRC